MNPADPADAIAHLAPKLRPILRRAKELGAFINFDMESYAHKNTTLELFKTLFTEPEFASWPHGGIVVQAYLRDAETRFARSDRAGARTRGTRFTVRLVKGAYWDYETNQIAAERLEVSGVAAETGERREFREAAPASCSRTNRSSLPRSVRITFAASPTRRRCADELGIDRAGSSFNCFTEWLGRSSARWSRWVIGCGNIRRSANCCPGCRISLGACSRTLPTKDFCARNFPTTSPPRNYCRIRASW